MEGLDAILSGSLERAPWGWALLGTIVLAMIKVRPMLTARAIKAREQIPSEKRDDVHDMRDRMIPLESKIEAAMQASHQTEMKLISAPRRID